MEYPCTLIRDNKKEQWTAQLYILRRCDAFIEAEIQGRSTYFHILTGPHRYGRYICIPNHDVGTELSHYKDLFWNTERLSGLMRKVDAVTVAYGLCQLEELIKPKENKGA